MFAIGYFHFGAGGRSSLWADNKTSRDLFLVTTDMIKQLPIIAMLLSCVAVSRSNGEPPIRPGDRIAIVGNTFADQLRIHGYLETLLLCHTRENPVSVRNLGWGGDMLTARDRPTNFPSERSTLADHKTDVIIACFGMGESFDGPKGIDDFETQLLAFVASHAGQKYNGETEVRLILVSPIAHEDLGRLTPNAKQRNHDLKAYSTAMREVAAVANVPFVDLFETSRYLMKEPVGPRLTSNGIHLNPYGYWAISKSFCRQLLEPRLLASASPWRFSIDARTMTSKSEGGKITQLGAENEGLRFRVTETSNPHLPPPAAAQLPSQLSGERDMLIVLHLEPGRYRLTVDGQLVATADDDAWSRGVAIDASPAHKVAEKYRASVNDKNLQFTYGWKALNQVHIVGERKRSPSGRALPGEVIEFHNIAKERDAELRDGIKLKTRDWRLVRVGS